MPTSVTTMITAREAIFLQLPIGPRFPLREMYATGRFEQFYISRVFPCSTRRHQFGTKGSDDVKAARRDHRGRGGDFFGNRSKLGIG